MNRLITDYGAVGDGVAFNTEAIQNAINDCFADGGGTVLVPSGTYLTGSIELKSNITLKLLPGSVIKASGSIEDYVVLPIASDEFKSMRPLIYAIDCKNVRITGEGEFDLNDEPYFDRNKLWMADEYESELTDIQLQETIVTPLDRPSQMFLFHQCNRVFVDGFAAYRCPCYSFLFSVCRDVKVTGLTIDNDLRGPNTDGMHFYSCKNVIVSNCNISTGDDCISVTGISNWDKLTENFLISNCNLVSRSSGIRLGHMASKLKNVMINNVTITNSNRGIGIFAADNGWVKNIIISNVNIYTSITAGSWWGNGEPLVISTADSTGQISSISMSHIHASSENGIRLVGKGGNIKDITFNDWRLSIRYGYNRPLFGKWIDLNPMPSRPAPEDSIPWLYASEAADIVFNNVKVSKGDDMGDNSIEPFLDSVENIAGLDY